MPDKAGWEKWVEENFLVLVEAAGAGLVLVGTPLVAALSGGWEPPAVAFGLGLWTLLLGWVAENRGT